MHETDRRGRTRYKVKLDVNYRHGDAYLYSRASNASEFGIFLVTDHPQPKGSILALEFKVPHTREPLTVAGEVIWIDDGARGQEPGMGIRFLDINAEQRWRIRSLIRIVARID